MANDDCTMLLTHVCVCACSCRECKAIKDMATCNSYKPVTINRATMLFYLNQDLDLLNTPVSNDT